jgi:formylglycine-generating enzyme required for sulfatase activity
MSCAVDTYSGGKASWFINAIGMEFILIPPGKFTMGTPLYEDDNYEYERPLHDVEITKPFFMQTTLVTQGQWAAVMGNNPSRFKDKEDNYPVDYVSWDDAQAFIRNLNDIERVKSYRLPTEAEWEYACRAGTTSTFSFGDSISASQACFDASGDDGNQPYSRTTIVKLFPPNSFGLYDMHGNLYEWCEDWFDEHYYYFSPARDPQALSSPWGDLGTRVCRGGSWSHLPEGLRSGRRYGKHPKERDELTGFRVVKERS